MTTSAEELVPAFGLEQLPLLAPRYNIAPTQEVAAVLAVLKQGGQRQLQMLRWGLIPSWARDHRIGNRLINARSETAAHKPAFRSAFRKHRCLVLADGFYEWRRKGQQRQPYLIRMSDGSPFGIAGLWEQWVDPEDGEVVQSCTLLTTGPNDVLEPIHDRMPVIILPRDYDLWLDPEVTDPELLKPLLAPHDPALMMAYPVSTRVNSPRHDDADCLARKEQIELF